MKVIDRRKYIDLRPLVLFVVLIVAIVGSTEAHNRETKEVVNEYVEEIASHYNVCPELIEAIIETESRYDTEAESSAGAIGLMQIIPRYHQARMERLGVTDLHDPYSNILVGVDYLMEITRDTDDLYEVLHIYHCGNSVGYDFNHPDYYEQHIAERSEELEREHGK